jgi:tetratricopeptide (TPR) repeat protein
MRSSAVLIALLAVSTPAPAAAPPRLPLGRWVEDLASDDETTWRKAVDQLWSAGRAAEPALRAVMKHPDPDVVLRARLVLGRFDWGIFPETPAAVVKVIERYRDGDLNQRKAAAEELIKLGRPGFVALQRLLARETEVLLHQHVAAHLKRHYRPLLRDMLRDDNRAGAVELLETAAATGNPEALPDLAAFWVLTGQTAAKARELEARAASDRTAAVRCAYLYRAAGDLAAARRLAEKAGDDDLLAGILDEQEDFKALARHIPPFIQGSPSRLAVLLHHAGDRAGFEEALKRLGGDLRTQATVLFFSDRPGEAIEADRQAGNLSSVCKMLALQGRRREALELSLDGNVLSPNQRVWLLLEQAVVCQSIGEKEKARQLLARGLQETEKVGGPDLLLGAVLRAGGRIGQRKEVLDDLGKVLDKVKLPLVPRSLLSALSSSNDDALALWWSYLRRKSPATPPSAVLARLNRWFVEGKAGKDFDALLAEVESSTTLPPAEHDLWPAVLARTCLAVGKVKKAEEILQGTARKAGTAAAYLRLADFYFERKQWTEAAAQYEQVLQRERSDTLAMYLRGAALVRAGQVKEGQALCERARLLPLGDEATRYTLARALERLQLPDEAAREWQFLLRTAQFRSIYAANAASALAARAVRRKQPLEAARCYRRVYLNLGLGGGAFLDETANLRVPALSHLYRARALAAAGKLDAALEEGKVVLEYLPEETGVVIDLVRPLERAKRKADADRLFDGLFNRLAKACKDNPKSAAGHNRLAWLAARCGRRLDTAVEHARTATTLTPDFAGYQDTLAEAHFQRGDKAEALAAIKRAVKLAPGQAYYAAQLRRIEAGDRNADVPEP